MNDLIEINRIVHVTAGFVGLAAFWVPVFTRKGGTQHRRFGQVFKYCAYIVLIAAMASVAMHMYQGLQSGTGPVTQPGPFAFLMFLSYLAVVTFIILQHGIKVLEHKDLVSLNTPINNILAGTAIWASIGLIGYTLYFRPPNQVVLYALSPIGLLSGIGIFKAIHGRRPEGKAWIYEHMAALFGAGIAFHTAFAVFGSTRLFDLGLEGFVAVIPWITPAIIGIMATEIWTRRLKHRYGDLA